MSEISNSPSSFASLSADYQKCNHHYLAMAVILGLAIIACMSIIIYYKHHCPACSATTCGQQECTKNADFSSWTKAWCANNPSSCSCGVIASAKITSNDQTFTLGKILSDSGQNLTIEYDGNVVITKNGIVSDSTNTTFTPITSAKFLSSGNMEFYNKDGKAVVIIKPSSGTSGPYTLYFDSGSLQMVDAKGAKAWQGTLNSLPHES